LSHSQKQPQLEVDVASGPSRSLVAPESIDTFEHILNAVRLLNKALDIETEFVQDLCQLLFAENESYILVPTK